MAYQPPLNGGRINASIGGNSTSAGAGYKLISTGNMILAGGNNITLSQNGSSISIVGGAGGGVALANSNTTVSSGTANLSVAGGAMTISGTNQSFNFSVPAQSNLSATGALSMSSNGNTISIGVPAFSAGISSNSTVTNQVIFAAGTNITLSQSTNATGATISIAGASGGGGGGSINFSAGTTSGNLASVTFANSNGIGFGLNSGTITASHNALTTQTVQTQSNIQGIIASGSTNYTGNISFANANGVSFGLDNGTITASAAGGGGGGGVAISGGGTSYGTGTVNFSNAGGALTIASSTGQALNFSVPATSSIVGGNGISISTTGSTISIYGGSAPTLSRWEYPKDAFVTAGIPINSVVSFHHEYIPFGVSGASAKIGVSMSVSTFTSASTASHNYSFHMGVYSLSGSTLSLITSASQSYAFSWGNTAASTSYSNLLMGVRQLTVPMNVNLTAGEYWMAALLSSASTFASAPMSIMGLGTQHAIATGMIGDFGVSTSAGRDVYLGQGLFSSNSVPTSLALTAVSNASASYAQRAGFYHVLYNATY